MTPIVVYVAKNKNNSLKNPSFIIAKAVLEVVLFGQRPFINSVDATVSEEEKMDYYWCFID